MSDLTGKQKAILSALVAAGIAASFAVGRFTAQVRVEERVEYRDRVVVEYRDREKKVEGPVRVQVVTRTTPGPRGPERVVIKTVDRGPVTTERSSEGQASSERENKTMTLKEPAGPNWLVGVSAGLRIDNAPLVYGGQVMRRFAGPFWLGVAADSGGSVRAQLAISF